MKILVVDVAAEHSGALSVLDLFIDEFKRHAENQYVVILSKPHYESTENVQFVNIEWVKKSYLHRIFFDSIYIRKIVRNIKPDMVLSLQNKAFSKIQCKQEVYFHNALLVTEKRFSFFRARKLWIYQNMISFLTRKSLKNANHIYVQADWIKKALVEKWKLSKDIISVKKPIVNDIYCVDNKRNDSKNEVLLFYPANGSVYKNHSVLLEACCNVWSMLRDKTKLQLALTCKKDCLPTKYLEIIDKQAYPVMFLGRLSQEDMKKWYSKSILVFPSYLETIGFPLLEAKCMESVIIASDCEYAHDVLRDYNKVTYFDPFSANELTNIIKRFVKS